MPEKDHTSTLTTQPAVRSIRPKKQLISTARDQGLTTADGFVASGQFLLAYLLDGSLAPDEVAWLPVELRRVRQLEETQRSCFVLRILAGWPRERCATTLEISEELVDKHLGLAAMSLVRLAEMERNP